MGFNKISLDAYVSGNSRELNFKVLNDATTAKLLMDSPNFQPNNKPGDSKLLLVTNTANFQARGCGRQLLGTTNLEDKNITTVGITDQQFYCTSDLYATYFVWALRNGMNPDGEFAPEFAGRLIDDKAAVIAETVETLIWQGDTASSNINLNKLNGFIKLILADAGHIELTSTATNIVERLQANFLQMPTAVSNASDFKVFLGIDLYNQYQIDAMNKNYFNPAAPYALAGTSATLVPTAGLNGTNTVVMARLADLALSTDLMSDIEQVHFDYSVSDRGYFMDVDFALGVQIVRGSQIGITDLA